MRFYVICALLCCLLIGCFQDVENVQNLENKVDSLSKILKITQGVYRSSYFLRLDSINQKLSIVSPDLDTFQLQDHSRGHSSYCLTLKWR